MKKEHIMKMMVRLCIVTVLGVAACLVVSICCPVEAQTKKVTALEGVQFDTSLTIADNLRTYVGKDVTVNLRSGKTFQGYVKTVGNGLLHLEKLAGKDFYDALIRIEDISAMEVKFRDMK
jgi:hypothetical protein